jgi:hypothetical protein
VRAYCQPGATVASSDAIGATQSAVNVGEDGVEMSLRRAMVSSCCFRRLQECNLQICEIFSLYRKQVQVSKLKKRRC